MKIKIFTYILLSISFSVSGQNSDALTILENGNIGINNDNPKSQLDVKGEVIFADKLTLQGNLKLSGQMNATNDINTTGKIKENGQHHQRTCSQSLGTLFSRSTSPCGRTPSPQKACKTEYNHQRSQKTSFNSLKPFPDSQSTIRADLCDKFDGIATRNQ